MGLHWISIFHLASPCYSTGLYLLFEHKHCPKFLPFFFVCLPVPSSESHWIHIPFSPIYHLTSSQNSPTATLGPVQSVACNNAGKIAMDPCMHFQQTIKPYPASSSHEPKAIGNCCMLTTAIQLTGQLGKAGRAIISAKEIGREWPDLLIYFTVQLLLHI